METRVHTVPLNGLKGLLILLIVLGHMGAMQTAYRVGYDALYTFHVAGFLLLPFLTDSPRLSWFFVKTRLVRYGVPFGWFFMFYSVLFGVVFVWPQGISVAAYVGLWLKGLTLASAYHLDMATGLKMLWFLPALLMLTILRAGWVVAPLMVRVVVLAGCCGVALTLGSWPEWKHNIPWGILIALAIFPYGLVVGWVHSRWQQSGDKVLTLGLAGLALLLLTMSVEAHVVVNIGDMYLYSLSNQPLLWLLHGATMVVVNVLLFRLAPVWERVPVLVWFGQCSMMVYLLHPLFNQALTIAVVKPLQLSAGVQMAVVFPLVAMLCLACGWGVGRLPWLQKLVFPKNGADMQQALRMLLKRYVY
ncbi:MAG: acyltransferase family protein [Alphaproteobacteria bacterium]